MKYLIVALFALITPTLSRPQDPQPNPQLAHVQPQRQPQPQAQPNAQSGVTPVSIVSQTEVVGPDGSFNYSYETSNGIHVEQGGFIKPGAAGAARSIDPNNPDETGDIQVIQGTYSYTAPDGQQISVRYVADDNGFQPEGDHIPTAPPIPADIARSLQQQDQQQPQQPQQQQQVHQQFQHQEFTSTSVNPGLTVTQA